MLSGQYRPTFAPPHRCGAADAFRGTGTGPAGRRKGFTHNRFAIFGCSVAGLRTSLDPPSVTVT